MYLWSQIGEKCMMALESKYWDLILLFKINVILLSISFFVFVCILCLGVAFITSAVATMGVAAAGGEHQAWSSVMVDIRRCAVRRAEIDADDHWVAVFLYSSVKQ